MATIYTFENMRDYIKRELGAPVINVEIDDSQLDQIIEDTIQFYNEENMGEGSIRTYLTFSATSGIDEYNLSGNNIDSVFDFSFQSAKDGLNVMFSPTNTLLYNDWVLQGNYPGSSMGTGSCQGNVLAQYQIAMGQLNDVKNMFERKYRVDWWPSKQSLKITPTPNEDLVGILLIYKKSEFAELFNNRFVKQLAVGKAKRLWGSILSKVQMQLPGGGTFNGDIIKEDGKVVLYKKVDEFII